MNANIYWTIDYRDYLLLAAFLSAYQGIDDRPLQNRE